MKNAINKAKNRKNLGENLAMIFSYRIKITDPLHHFDVILEYFLIPLGMKITLKMCKTCHELVRIERFYHVFKSALSYCFKAYIS